VHLCRFECFGDRAESLVEFLHAVRAGQCHKVMVLGVIADRVSFAGDLSDDCGGRFDVATDEKERRPDTFIAQRLEHLRGHPRHRAFIESQHDFPGVERERRRVLHCANAAEYGGIYGKRPRGTEGVRIEAVLGDCRPGASQTGCECGQNTGLIHPHPPNCRLSQFSGRCGVPGYLP
jgi:hypothetical protein